MAAIILTEQASKPSTPSAGDWKIYPKSDGWYILDDAGTESPLIPPTSSAEINVYPAHVRASVVSGDPNPTTDQNAKANVYVMPDGGNTLPLWGGSAFSAQTFAELTAALSATYQTATNVYDVYIFSDSGTIRAGFGVAWTSATSRGTGAGTAETEVANGVMVNKNSMTVRNGASSYTVAARYGTVVGTISPSTNGQLEWTRLKREICNRYNTLPAGMLTCPAYNNNNTEDTWTQNSGSYASANGGTGSRLTWVQCTPQVPDITCHAVSKTTQYCQFGAGIDSATNPSGQMGYLYTAYSGDLARCNNKGLPLAEGLHYAELLVQTSGSMVFLADRPRSGAAEDPMMTYMEAVIWL